MSLLITTDVSNYEAKGFGDPTQKMKALTWQAKDVVKLGQSLYLPQPSFHSLNLQRVRFAG